MSEQSVFRYEEFIPTDKWTLQDWYIAKVIMLENIYFRIVKAFYLGGSDHRSLMVFFASVRSYHIVASKNMEKFLCVYDKDKKVSDDSRYVRLKEILSLRHQELSFDLAEELMGLLSFFHFASGLTDLSESRPVGDFARARARVGLGAQKEDA